MPFEKHKINNLTVKAAPKKGGDDPRPIRGAGLFKDPFCNVYLSAKKKSGKTSNLFFILSRIISKRTKLVVFCSTVHKDPTWRFMIDYFESKGIDIETHTSLKEDGVDLLKLMVDTWDKEIEEEDKPKEEPDPKELIKQKGTGAMRAILAHNLPQMEGEGTPKKPKKSKYNERKVIFVLDDLSTELKTPSLIGLMKKSRHYKASILLSSQYYLDIKPECRKQIDVFLLYKGQTEQKLEAIYDDADLSIEYDEFKQLYNDATKEPYSFLYVDTRNDEFRENYNKQFKI